MWLSRAELRELDRRAIQDFGIAGAVLMENAGRGVAELLESLGICGPVAICCGKGNNGGDGFVIARHLAIAQVEVSVHLFGRPEELTNDAAANFHILQKSAARIEVYPECNLDLAGFVRTLAVSEWVVDALFGTGLSRPIKAPFAEVLEAMNAGPAKVLAVDIPSGLDCDTGLPLGMAVRATHTATFAAVKKGFVNPSALAWLGKLHVIDIGIPHSLTESLLSSERKR